MIKYALNNPIKVLVGVLFVILFGIQGFLNMPYRLIPNIESPEITIRTNWDGASPYDMEKEVVDRQERALKSIPGLKEFDSMSFDGRSHVKLVFDLSVDIDNAILLVSNKLDEVKGYPDNIDRPIIRSTDSDSFASVELMMTTLPENSNSIDIYLSYFEEVLKPYIERVQGVADIWFWGGKSKEMHIELEPEKLTAYNISVGTIISKLQKENVDISVGSKSYGKKNYRFRAIGESLTPEDIANIAIVNGDNSRLKLGDIATVKYGYEKSSSVIRYNNSSAINIGIIAQAGYNILDLTTDLEKVIGTLNEGVMKEKGIQFIWISDQKSYILNAIGLVKSNILVGGILSIIVLLVFLRNIRSTLVIAVTIPISIIGTFFIMYALGRTLNVISLAGIAFSVGMLIDNSIVVLENIDRHMKMNKSLINAVYDGTKEVWGAILASTLTTIAVFLPIVFIREEIGQLFGDIAIAVSSSVALSLIASVFIIPVSLNIIHSLKLKKEDNYLGANHNQTLSNIRNYFHNLSIKIGKFGNNFVELIVKTSIYINQSTKLRLIVIIGSATLSILSVFILMPKMNYLPLGNKNMIEAKLATPPGISVPEKAMLGEIIYQEIKPYTESDLNGYDRIKTFGYIGGEHIRIVLTSTNEENVSQYRPLLNDILSKIPGIKSSTSQSPLFKVAGGQGNEFQMNVSGNIEYEKLIEVAQNIRNRMYEEFPNIQLSINPTADPIYPEVRLIPNRETILSSGLSTEEIAQTVDVLLDGKKVGEFKDSEVGNIDMILKGPYTESLEMNMDTLPLEVGSFLVNSNQGQSVPIFNLMKINEVNGVERIRRYNSQRAFHFKIILGENQVLEELNNDIMERVINPMRAEGKLENIIVTTAGASSKLSQAKNALSGNFIMAILITYFLMAGLLNNFVYPLIILITIPLAASGGFIGLSLTNLFVAFQGLDVITMLGFIMLVGTVVNNPILLIYQALHYIKRGLNGSDAITLSLKTRIRPIAMSTTTSLFGMLPLVLAPGAGSELYRGMGSVILGGLGFATIFTLFVIPAMLSFFLNSKEGKSINEVNVEELES